MNEFNALESKNLTIIIHTNGTEIPSIIYWGKKINNSIFDSNLSLAIKRPIPQAFLDEDVKVSLLPEEGRGFYGNPGLKGVSCRKSWTTQFQLQDMKFDSQNCNIKCIDKTASLELLINLQLDYETGVLQISNSIKNIGSNEYDLHDFAVTLPVDRSSNELLSFKGRWIHEFTTERINWNFGSYVRENRKGRTSHDNIPYLVVGNKGFSESKGELYGFHFAWSGNNRLNASVLSDGSKIVQFSELLLPGEIVLGKNETYHTPKLYAAYSSEGLNVMSNSFHTFLRNSDEFIKFKRKDRLVHFNTWEAVYFDHTAKTLNDLVDKASDLGIERFILDDGWFNGRNGEKAGLGDWYVDKNKYPQGLNPLINYVQTKGMEFGIWFEPEMVNSDSDLFRNHPDWVLQVSGYKQPLGRYQYVIDLSNNEAFNYIFERVDCILEEYEIGYVKWDMNRDLCQPGNNCGIVSVHSQVKYFYRLLKLLNKKHPDIEFESCASGGGRADFEVLKYTNRIWTSDCNDPLERHLIQKGFSYFLPQEIMGAHFGPSPAHTTMRESSLQFRILTSMIGHLGFEQNVLTLSDNERKQLKEYIKLYKKYRNLIHNGDFFRLDTDDTNLNAYGVVSKDKNEAVLWICQLVLPEFQIPEKVRIPYLNNNVEYIVNVLDKPENMSFNMKKTTDWLAKNIELTGEILEKIGIQLPVMDPESIILIHFVAN